MLGVRPGIERPEPEIEREKDIPLKKLLYLCAKFRVGLALGQQRCSLPCVLIQYFRIDVVHCILIHQTLIPLIPAPLAPRIITRESVLARAKQTLAIVGAAVPAAETGVTT